MPGGKEHYENLLHALHDPDDKMKLSREDMERCAARMAAYAWKLCGKRIGKCDRNEKRR